MLRNLFSHHLFIGTLIFVLLLLMGCGLFYGRKVAQQTPAKVYKPVEVEQPTEPKRSAPGETTGSGHWHGNEWHAEPHEAEKLPLVKSDETSERFEAPWHSGGPPLPPSSVPDNIPPHLKFPEKWRTGYYYNFSEGTAPEISSDDAKHLLEILEEIIRDYNPKRPIGDIWDHYIEYEKMYRAYAEYELGYTPLGGLVYNRADWQYEQTWAFPEVMEVMFEARSNRDNFELLATARDIAMGELEPNWNEHIMHDGRAFYLRYDTRYEFKWGTEERGGSIGFSRTSDKSAPLVVVYPDTASDEELQRLGWWNFHINPYTQKPVNYQPYQMKYKSEERK